MQRESTAAGPAADEAPVERPEDSDRTSGVAPWRRSFWLQTALVVALFSWMRRELGDLCTLPYEAYFSPFLLPQMVLSWPLLAFTLLGVGILALRWRHLTWRSFDSGCRTRAFVGVVAAVMAWSFATLDYNFFFDQGYGFDRVLLMAFLVLLWVHPLFVHPFLVTLMVLGSQVEYPLAGAGWTWVDKGLPVDVLSLFLCFLLVKAVLPVSRSWFFLFLSLCLVGATYGRAALGKLSVGDEPWSWLAENQLPNLLVSSYVQGGWLEPLGAPTVVALASFLAPLAVVMAGATLLIELAGFVLVISPRWTRMMLVLFPVMHGLILASSGIFFWKWIVLDLALLWYLHRYLKDQTRNVSKEAAAGDGSPLFARRQRVASALVIAFLAVAVLHVDFAWFDSKFTNFFTFHGVDDDGRRHRLDARFFAPYDILFQQSQFFYATEEPILAGTFGTVRDEQLFHEIERGPEALPESLSQLGKNHYHDASAGNLAYFLQRWLTRYDDHDGRFWPHRFAPPFHFQTHTTPEGYDWDGSLRWVEVRLVRYYFDGDRILPLGSEPVLAVPLDGAATSGARSEVPSGRQSTVRPPQGEGPGHHEEGERRPQ